MFATLGLFKDIPCPEGQECSLMRCMFSHTHSSDDPSPTPNTSIATEGTTSIPSKSSGLQKAPAQSKGTSRVKPSPPVRTDSASMKAASSSPANKKPRTTPSSPSTLHSTARAVSPPRPTPVPTSAVRNATTPTKPTAQLPLRKAPRESLNPRMLPKAPTTHTVRMSILKKLHGAMASLNNKIALDKANTEKSLVLSPDELITMALDEEEKAAKDNASVYSNVIKLRIVKLAKMSNEDWLKEVKAHLNERYYKLGPVQTEHKPKVLTTGLSPEEEITIARRLITPLQGLEQHGYVTKAPSNQEVENARKGVVESKGWEKCDRCGGRFQVFPGRREDGSLTTGGQCTHHPGKPLWPPRQKTDRITGSREAYFSCCNEPVGTSSGCTKSPTHVFKVSETKRLASVLQFEITPEQPDKGPQPPVCFDCEMGYTTLGLELIRLTAVSWPEGKNLLDVLVRPIGEILDLNSRFSGVFPEHYTQAVPYGSPAVVSTPTGPEEGEIQHPPLQVVESPAAARALLFQLLQPDTPLIGHAIDNDLNACRIIHPTVIDTVILYPAAGGLPNRMALRTLARRHLEREIQTGGNRGHDSKEDATATGDLVRVKVAETWKILKSKGWVLQAGQLVPPPGATEDPAESKLGGGAGQKRSNSTLD
ncbi:hypothetical protein BDV59DRAFT_170099 [Aspergillus ambiguus]|uniref:putative RNA exonuclease Rex3 n=1 Tax=Aspergillus ambiguus TaxID=176160 RepID=UPI003CCCC871